jgi:hypothetical protein
MKIKCYSSPIELEDSRREGNRDEERAEAIKKVGLKLKGNV